MQTTPKTSYPILEFSTVLRIAKNGKVTIAISVFLSAVLALSIAFLSEPIYFSQTLISPELGKATSGSTSSFPGGVGSLASLAGLKLPGEDERNKAIAILKSRHYSYRFLESNNIVPLLFPDKWNSESVAWDVESPEEIPSIEDAYKKFKDNVLSVSLDKESRFVRLGVKWHDPVQASNWANLFVAQLNEYLREAAVEEARENLKFLRQEAASANAIEIRQGLFRLIQTQIETAMLASGREDFAFEVIDPAFPSDTDGFIWPRRKLIVVVGVVFGALLGFFIAAMKRIMPSG